MAIRLVVRPAAPAEAAARDVADAVVVVEEVVVAVAGDVEANAEAALPNNLCGNLFLRSVIGSYAAEPYQSGPEFS